MVIELQVESNVLSERQLARVASLTAARGVLISRGFASASAADPVDLVNLALFIESGQDPYALEPVRESGPAYPFDDGDVTRLGPEVFASNDGQVISWQGENYYRADNRADDKAVG